MNSLSRNSEGMLEEEKKFEIYFRDLIPGKQKELLAFYGIEKPGYGNFDVFPVCVLYSDDVEQLK